MGLHRLRFFGLRKIAQLVPQVDPADRVALRFRQRLAQRAAGQAVDILVTAAPTRLQILRIRDQRFQVARAQFQCAQQPVILALFHFMLGARREPCGQGLRRLIRLQARHAVFRQMRQRGVHQAGVLDIVVGNGFRRIAFEQLAQPIRLFEMRRHLHHGHAGRDGTRRQRHGFQQRGGGRFAGQGGADPAILRHAVRPAKAADIRGAAEAEVTQDQMGVVGVGAGGDPGLEEVGGLRVGDGAVVEEGAGEDGFGVRILGVVGEPVLPFYVSVVGVEFGKSSGLD